MSDCPVSSAYLLDPSIPAEERVGELARSILPVAPAAEDAAWARLDSLTKPPRSLGALERVAARVAAIQGDVLPDVSRKAVLLMAGDHGVVAEGVSPYPQDVTWQMVANFVAGGAAINSIAESVGAELRLYDMGIAADVSHLEGVADAKVAAGTANMAIGPAMSREQACEALARGAAAAIAAADDGIRLLGTGEMGIGNTTSAAALTCAFAGAAPLDVVGPGTGLDAAGVAHKAHVVARALDVNRYDELDVLGVLAAVGGLEIAGLAGVVLGGAAARVPVVSDGYICGAATLAAVRLVPAAAAYVLPSHQSAEPGHAVILDALGLEPLLRLDMRLGEGTGAALAMALVEAACRMMSGMATFAEAGVSEAQG